MAGWEQLTPDQILLIMYLILSTMLIYVVGGIVKAIINSRTAKQITFNVEREIVKHIQTELNKPSLFVQIKNWWVSRKERKATTLEEKAYGVMR